MSYLSQIVTPAGKLTAVSDGDSLIALDSENSRFQFDGLLTECGDLPVFNDVKLWLNEYFSGEIPTVPLKLAPTGTVFRRKVWDILLEIPYGETVTYGYIAKRIERENNCRMSAQAVGNAVGHNPIGIIIPCHRVIGSDGSMVGYGGGLEMKKYLLQLERQHKTVV